MSFVEKYRPCYTYEDYCQWDGNWELIDGMPYARFQQVKYYLFADPQFKKSGVYQLLNNKYEPVAVNPGNYTFHLTEVCNAVDLSHIWD